MKFMRKVWPWGVTTHKRSRGRRYEIIIAYIKWTAACERLLEKLRSDALDVKNFHADCKLFKLKVLDDISARQQHASFYLERLAYLNNFYDAEHADTIEKWTDKAASLETQRQQAENWLRLKFPKAKRLLTAELKIYKDIAAVTEDFIASLKDHMESHATRKDSLVLSHFMLTRALRFSSVHWYETVRLMNRVVDLLNRKYDWNLIYENPVQLPLDGLISQVGKCSQSLTQMHRNTVQYEINSLLTQHYGNAWTRYGKEEQDRQGSCSQES